MLSDRWYKLMGDLGFQRNDNTYDALVTAYSEPHRHYHTAEHISATLAHFDSAVELTERAEEVEIALWFHDAIYKPFSSSNESDSADWAAEFLTSNGADNSVVKRVHRLIMATLHTATVESSDESLLVDVDLSILGSPIATYTQFEKNVRREYKRVPYFLYRKKRKEILQSFLAREVIYYTDIFKAKWEKSARKNLLSAIENL